MNPPASSTAKDSEPVQTGAPSGSEEKRKNSRVPDRIAVTLVSSRGLLSGHMLSGMTRDYDSLGACVLADRALPLRRAVRVRLHLSRSISSVFRGLPCEFRGRVAAIRKRQAGAGPAYELVIKWDRPLAEMVDKLIASYQRKIGFLIATAMASIVVLRWQSVNLLWYTPFFFLYSLTLLAYLVSRFFISWRHRSPVLKNYTPTVSVIISVRNEQDAIERTVETCFKTDYPSAKREILVVDDGSTDGTPEVLKRLLKKHEGLKIWTLPPSGKRAAMAAGVLRATGEIIIFVDSDTFLFPDALRHIVCGFEDPTLGASAGYTEVENADTNALTGLQEVRYFVSYRLLKSSESLFNCVTCCPGCLSAYRRKYVLDILEPWLHQKFLGAPATFGDDRSLTNFILRRYRVIYNDLAVASTLVPVTWGHYLRQQVRWKKSWLRETLIAGRFMYKKHPIAAISFYSAAIFSLLSPAMAARVVYLALHGHDHGSILVYYLLGLVLIGMLQSLYFLYKRPSPHWLLGLLWMASSLLLTGPQTYYAIMTMRKNHWGTR